MNPNNRIIINVCATYGRMLLSAGLTLFSTRWLFAALGEEDYGLLAVVGSLIGLFTFLNTSLASSAQRHFAYAIGGGDIEHTRSWFNTSVLIHLILALTVLLIGIPASHYIAGHVLTKIPPERLPACLVVIDCSFINAFMGIAAVPFVAMLIAKQRLVESAVFALVGSVLNFGLAYYLLHVAGDRLECYAIWTTLINGAVQFALVARVSTFIECKIVKGYLWSKARAAELFAFAGWTLFGVVGNLGRYQGMPILLNMFFGPRVNSALGVANQIAAQTDTIAQGLFGALAPEIVASEGRGDRQRMITLALRTSKFTVLMTLFLLIPVIAEMDGILTLWLKTPPQYTSAFCNLILVTFLVDRMTSGYMAAVSAHGRIAAYQATLGGLLLLTFPLGYIVLALGGGPTAAIACILVMGSLCSFGRVFWVQRLLQVSPMLWVQRVVKPTLAVILPSAIVCTALVNLLDASFLRIVFCFGISTLVTALAIWFKALEPEEKQFVLAGLGKIRGRFVKN